MTKQLLIETMPVAFTILEESSKTNGHRMTVAGIFGSCDEINGNGRLYPESIMDREIEKLQPLIESRCVYSEADHPEDGKSRIRYTAAMPTKLEKKEIDGRKVYLGEAVILNTVQGMNLQEIIRAGGKVGVSQRGWGDLAKGNWNGKSTDIVQENYTLKTFDFVIGQSTKGATVSELKEQVEIINLIESGPCEGCQNSTETKSKGGTEQMEIKTLEELRKAFPELCLKLEEEAMAKKEKELKEAMKKEWDAGMKGIADGIRKQIEESKEYKDFKAGMETQKATLVEVAKLVKPYISEGAADDDSTKIEEEIKKIRTELEAVKGENKALKEQTEREKTEASNKEKVEKRIQEVTAGKEHEKLLVERLQGCKTVEEVNVRLTEEEAFIKKILPPKDPTKGDGKVLNENAEDDKKKFDASKERDRKVAGLA